MKLLFSLIASATSGVLLFLAFPNYDWGWLAWVGLTPLLVAIHDKRILTGFVFSLITGIIFTAGIYDWILVVRGYRFYHHAILVFYLALYFGMFGLIFGIVAKQRSVTFALLLAPFIWVVLEYIRSNLLFLALPWALLAHSQHHFLPVIQIASITGAYGISFLVVLANSALTSLLLSFWGRSGSQRVAIRRPSQPVAAVITASTAVLFGLVLIYGWLALSEPNGEKHIKISVLQGDIEQDRKWDPNFANIIMETYTNLSRNAARDNPALIVWPEAATPGFILKNIDFYKQTAALIRETRTHFIIGSSEYPKFKPKAPIELGEVGNSALFFSPTGKVIGQYFKIHLVPFVEIIPYDGEISWPRFISPRKTTRGKIQGKDYTLFELDGSRFGVSICWESLFPDLFRKFVKHGANFMLNISSEAWFGASAFQYQFLAATKFRAVENRIAIARAGNYTLACFIDPFGRITRKDFGSIEKDIIRKGYLTRKIAISRPKTFYTDYGDLFVYIVGALAILGIVYAMVSPSKRKKSGLP